MTPMMRQYHTLKERSPDSILFFRLGDFYEMFGDDAKTASKELDLTLTTRDRSTENPDERVPMCGVPYHSSEAYIARLIAKGYKVSICEQVEEPGQGQALLERDIVRVVTPGTLIEPSMLDEGKPNYLCAVYLDKTFAVCFSDMSTGEISVTEFDDMQSLENELGIISPAEAILGGNDRLCEKLREFLTSRLNCLAQYRDELFRGDKNLEFFADLPDISSSERRCAGALVSYITDTQKSDTAHLKTLSRNTRGTYMELDLSAARNLELVASLNTGEKRGSLLWSLDRTKTPMGRRLLRSWTLRPLLDPRAILFRQAAVDEFFGETVLRGEVTRCLKNICDLERLMSKIVYGSAGGRDLKALAASFGTLPEIVSLLSLSASPALRQCAGMDTLADIAQLIDETIKDAPPHSVREGGFIEDGINAEVDYLRSLLNNSAEALVAIETRERERTGKKLKIGYNKVFGYYLEIPRSQSEDVPGDYIRKQTLSGAERFITQDLKELETELLGAKDKLATLEYNLFCDLLARVSAGAERVTATSRLVAELDVYSSLAEAAHRNRYVKPEIDDSGIIEIRDGRHPVVEIMQSGSLFVPNDTFLDCADDRTALITGPNMAGKSTYMRQIALCVIMAQMGSFIPASSARIGVVDRVFTRIGASDDLSAGKSTFMVEMTEVADILKNATPRSLLILDEIGRGTSTYDGMSVSRAVLEYCAETPRARTLFSTHYHELTELEINGVRNYNISAKKRGDDIIFLRKIVPGAASESYGIEVAGLAGVPMSVIDRAKDVLYSLESGDMTKSKNPKPPHREPEPQQTPEIAAILQNTDLNTLSPLEALSLLFDLKKRIENQ